MPEPYRPQDKYFHKAKAAGFRARSAFKLLQLQEKFRLLKPGLKVLDLGAAPGSWLQVLSKAVEPGGEVLGLDLQKIQPVRPNVKTYEADITNSEKLKEILGNARFDLITADLAPKTTGIKDADQYHATELNLAVLEIAKVYLKRNGILLSKFFAGPDQYRLLKAAKQIFKICKIHKPPASRESSVEYYLICRN